MLRSRLFVWHKNSSIIDDFFCAGIVLLPITRWVSKTIPILLVFSCLIELKFLILQSNRDILIILTPHIANTQERFA